jgi:DNA-binding NarL/FixJ family response regulator
MLAEADPDVRRALRIFLAHDRVGMQLVGEVADAADLRSQLHDARPDLLLVDWGLLGAGVNAALASLRAGFPNLQVIVLSGHPEVRRQALAAGVDDFVSKADSPEQMVKTLRAARARGSAGRADGSTAMMEGTDE